MARPQRVALIGVGHYHTTWYPAYLQLLKDQKVKIVGIHDPDAALAADRAQRFESTPYTDYRRMLDETKPQFVVALGRHVDMPPVFRYLVDAGVPFLMEKPWAIDLETLNELVGLATDRKAWVAAPLPMRYTLWAERARAAVQGGEFGPVSHIIYRMIRPGVQRYIDQGCEWMLSKETAGGGVLMNLGCHGFDLARFITGEEPEIVSAVVSHAVCGLDVDDYAFVTLRTPSGIIFHNEVGYTFADPDGDDNERKLAARDAVLIGLDDGFRLQGPSHQEIERQHGGRQSWDRVIDECLNALERGDPPPITALDCQRAMTPVFDAYRLAGEP